MILSAKQKRVFNIVLVTVVVAIMLTGIGLGVYFILKDKGELTARQKQFVNAVNLTNTDLCSSEIDISLLPLAVQKNNIISYDGDYVLVSETDGAETIYSLKTNSQVNINALVLYDKVEALCGSYAIVSYEGVNKLVDLTTGNLVCTLSNASWQFIGEHILIKTNDGSSLKYVPNNQTGVSYVAVLFNTKNREAVLEVKESDNAIDIQFTENFVSVISINKTDVYSLANFSHILTLENQGEANSQKNNIQSTINGNSYFMSVYYRVFELSRNLVLIEKACAVDSDDFTIKSVLDNGASQKYELTYQVYDVVSESLFNIQSSNRVVKAKELSINEDYFALLFHDVENENYVSESQVQITYYQIDGNKKGERSLYKIVSYDYVKNGIICGYNGSKLLTKGGEVSKPISFNGNESSKIDLQEGNKLDGTNNKNVLIETTALGQKKILSINGETLIDDLFLEVSPFNNTYAVSRDASSFYLISVSGEKVKIENFALKFKDYVFMGIGMYFTVTGDNLYNVYELGGSLLYENVNVAINYNSKLNKLLLYIGGNKEKLLEITPVDGCVVNTETGSSGVYSFLESTELRNFAFSADVEQYKAEDTIQAKKISVDNEFGYGLAEYGINLKLSDLTDKFENYSTLTNQEKAIIPMFDNPAELSYVSDGKSLVFNGVYFLSGDNFVLAVIRLKYSNENYYMVNVAFSDVYLKHIAVSYNTNLKAKFVYNGQIIDANIDSSSRYVPAISLEGVGLTYFDNEINDQRTVDYSLLGYDGGLVFALGNASKIDIEFTLSNIFLGSDYDSGYLTVEEQTKDFGKFEAIISEANGVKYLTLSVNEGYFITGFNLATYNMAASIYETAELNSIYSVSELCSSYKVKLSDLEGEFSLIRLFGIRVVERYAEFKFVNHDGAVVNKTYYYYGYGLDVSLYSNPAYFGFDNFVRKDSVEVPIYRIGYDFNGYALNGNLIINSDGEFVGQYGDFGFDYTVNEPQTLIFNASYTAKKYTIYFKDGDEALPGEEKEISYDSPVGALPELSRVGYTLQGWYDQSGRKYNSTTLYQVDSHTTLIARWKADVYDLVFDANFGGYTGAVVNGYDYNVLNAQFTKSFKNFSVGNKFTLTSKEITYDQLYGELPYIMGYGKNGDVYMFVGWFENSDPLNKGEEYTNASRVTIDSARTLYAHYTKEIYSIKLEIAGEFKDKLAEIRYAGANSQGEASSFSTIAGNADNLIVLVDNELILYTLQSKTINIGVSLLPGYHISEMQVDYAGGVYYYDESALSPTNGNFGFTDAEAASGDIQVTATSDDNYNLDVALTMTEGQASGDYDAQIMLVTEETKYSNTITIEGQASIFDPKNNVPVKQYKDSELAYNTEKRYQLNPDSAGGEVNIDFSYLSSLKVDEEELLSFDIDYTFNDTMDKWILDLNETSVSKAYDYRLDAVSGGTERSQIYSYPKGVDVTNRKIILEVAYSINTGYEYYLTIISTKDYNITATFKDFEGTLKTQINVAGENNSNGQLNKTDYSGTRLTETFTESDYKIISKVYVTYETVVENTVDDTVVDDTVVDDTVDDTVVNNKVVVNNKMIFAREIVAGFNSATINNSLMNTGWASTNSNITKPEGLTHEVNTCFTEYTENFVNYVKLNAAGVSIYWDTNKKELVVEAYNFIGNLTITVEYIEYRLIQINIPDGEKDAIDTLKINETDFKDDLGKETTKVSGSYVHSQPGIVDSSFAGEIYSYHNAQSQNEGPTSYLILLLGKNLHEAITLTTKNDESSIYAIKSNDITITELTQAKISDGVNYCLLTVEALERKLTIESFLGIGQGNYILDDGDFPNGGDAIFNSGFSIEYNGGEQIGYEEYIEGKQSLTLKGNKLSFKYQEKLRDVYTLNKEKSGFYSASGELEENLNSLGWASGTKVSYSVGLDIFEIDFRLYYDVISYSIKYEVYCTNGQEKEVSGAMQDETHYFNVWSKLPENGYNVEHYTFIGYSKSKAENPTWKEDDEIIDNNFNLSYTEGQEVTIYCLFEPNVYTINFNTNKGLGSSAPSTVNETYKVTFDSVFTTLPTITRTGYTFGGWYTAQDDGYQITTGSQLNDNTYNSFETDDSSATLYAHWAAKTYTINFNTNKGLGSSDPSTVNGTYTVTFDSVFPTLPTITRTGYAFSGWATKTDSSGEEISSGMSFDNDLYKSLSITEQRINVYAIWTANKYTLTLNISGLVESLESYDGEQLQLYGDCPIVINGTNYYTANANITFDVFYDSPILSALPEITVTGYKDDCLNFNWNSANLTDSTKFNNESQTEVTANLKTGEQRIQYTLTNLTTTFASVGFSASKPLFSTDVILAIEVSDVQFIKSLLFTFGSGVTYQIDACWDSDNSKVYVDVNKNGRYDLGEEISSSGLELEGYVANAFNSISIKQPETGKFEIVMCFVKNNINITEGSIENRTYSVNYYYKIDNSHSIFKETKTIITGNNLTNELEPYYIMGSTFVGWYYDESAGNAVIANAGITSNGNIYAIYNSSSTEHSVSFYYWDITQDKYVESARETYKLWERGGSFASTASQYFNTANISTAGGRTIKMPSPASEIWPTGTYFAGYIIASSVPASGYYTSANLTGSGRNGDLTLFDNTNMVDSSLKVYAMYDEYKFSVSEGINISFGEILPDGTVRRFTSSDVVYVRLSGSQYSQYLNYINQDGLSKEAAMTAVLGNDIITSNYYDFGVIIKTDSNGNKYIFAVSDDYTQII